MLRNVFCQFDFFKIELNRIKIVSDKKCLSISWTLWSVTQSIKFFLFLIFLSYHIIYIHDIWHYITLQSIILYSQYMILCCVIFCDFINRLEYIILSYNMIYSYNIICSNIMYGTPSQRRMCEPHQSYSESIWVDMISIFWSHQ